MASKNLRALSVRGCGSASRAVPDRQSRRDLPAGTSSRLFDASPAHHGQLRDRQPTAQASLVDLMASRRMMPTANFRRTFFEGYRAFSGSYHQGPATSPSHYACHGCPIALQAEVGAGDTRIRDPLALRGPATRTTTSRPSSRPTTSATTPAWTPSPRPPRIACLGGDQGASVTPAGARGQGALDHWELTREAELLRHGFRTAAPSSWASRRNP
ncbi:MAG: aldehyde ferredoxin oxidoreductase C-terminal domain-containing protein [Desulfomicrobium escambiense]|nr:aldehyde ferredoxin oxidoreductase C-terminal domain-containing protein [Desulfomicrobium escambiense]